MREPSEKHDEKSLSIHSEHRKRVKSRFLERGFEGFSDHEILEMLLYYALPRKDTNAVGHELMNRFGSLSAVFEAPVHELCKVSGVSEHTAVLLKMVPGLAKAYLSDRDRDRETFGDHDKAGRFFVTKFIGATNEDFYVAFLDNGMHLIDCIRMHAGDVNSSQVSLRKLAEHTLSKNASFVMIAHNHPNGTIIPSSDDLNVTRACEVALDIIGTKLVEHYIIAGDKYMGIMKMRASYDNGGGR